MIRPRRSTARSRPPASTSPAAIANRSHTWPAPVGGSTATATVIGSESWLLAVVVSPGEVETHAVLLIVVPAAAFTVVVNVKVADSLTAIDGLVHDSLPGLPVIVPEQSQPAGEVNDTSVNVDGRLSTMAALSAASGPLFRATRVQVVLPPGLTTVGVAVLVMAMSAIGGACCSISPISQGTVTSAPSQRSVVAPANVPVCTN